MLEAALLQADREQLHARLRERFAEPFTVGGETFVPELRVGLVPDLGPELSAQAALAQAQAALRPVPGPGEGRLS